MCSKDQNGLGNQSSRLRQPPQPHRPPEFWVARHGPEAIEQFQDSRGWPRGFKAIATCCFSWVNPSALHAARVEIAGCSSVKVIASMFTISPVDRALPQRVFGSIYIAQTYMDYST